MAPLSPWPRILLKPWQPSQWHQWHCDLEFCCNHDNQVNGTSGTVTSNFVETMTTKSMAPMPQWPRIYFENMTTKSMAPMSPWPRILLKPWQPSQWHQCHRDLKFCWNHDNQVNGTNVTVTSNFVETMTTKSMAPMSPWPLILLKPWQPSQWHQCHHDLEFCWNHDNQVNGTNVTVTSNFVETMTTKSMVPMSPWPQILLKPWQPSQWHQCDRDLEFCWNHDNQVNGTNVTMTSNFVETMTTKSKSPMSPWPRILLKPWQQSQRQ